jgi:epidermal growth factor receptor substrate 15
MQNDGKLTQDTFAVAMHLINEKLAGKPVPERLPKTLIPPTLREQPTTKPHAPVSQIQRDLFELENSPPGSPIIPEQLTGGFGTRRNLSTQNTGTSGSAFPPLPGAFPGAVAVSPPRSLQQSPFVPPGES